MSDTTKPVALPAYLPKRLQAFRVVRGAQTTYLLRDKLGDRTHDLEPWQFFVLEVLPGAQTVAQLQTQFADRWGTPLDERDVLAFFGHLADERLLDDSAGEHPLLKPFLRRSYTLVDGEVKRRSFERLMVQLERADAAPAPAPAPAQPTSAPQAPPQPQRPPASPPPAVIADARDDLPAGVREADALDPRQSKLLLRLFPMRPLALVLLPLVDPLKVLVYALPLVALAALLLVARNAALAWQDLGTLRQTTTLAAHALFSLLTINLTVTVTQALVAQKFRASVGDFGVGLRFGFFPRFMVPIGHTKQLSRRERMWLHAAPLLMRVALFSAGALAWYALRDNHLVLAKAGLALAFLCGVNLLFESGNPLVKGNAYHLLAAFVDEPYLRGKAWKAFMDRIGGAKPTEANQNILAAYALASFVYAWVVVALIVLVTGNFLVHEMQLGGAAIVAVAALGIYLAVRTQRRFRAIGHAYERSVQFERWRRRALPTEAGETAQQQPIGSRVWRYASRVALLALLVVAFLPYPYDAGGDFEIFPAERQVITTDIPGIVEEILYDGGETVKKGAVIARVAATDLTAQIAVIDARIAEQQSAIADLRAKPKKEEIVVATRELETAQQRASFTGPRVPRYERLYRERTISFEEYDGARREAEVDRREVATRQAALVLVKTGTPPDRIAAEEAKLKALEQQRAEVEGRAARTTMKMPFDGNILTLHLKQRLNSVLDRGAPFATVESIGEVTAEIDVPESDIGHVQVGSRVRLRPNAYFDRTFDGSVRTIDRNVTAKAFGKVVKAIAVVDDRRNELKTGMTGYAKVDAGTIPVWKAFSLALVRFFQVQVWSWIP